MNPFFFGSSERPLYGVHHEPTSVEVRQSAVLVCYPFGREYMRCHRALVKLCDRLAGSGYHCLRFDYYGTGDSAGESGEGDVDVWVGNARSAAQELLDISGLERLSLVGVRLGAAIAMRVAFCEFEIDRIVLWDPVVSGRQHLDELESMHARFVVDTDRFPNRVTARNVDDDELVGMICPPAMRESIRSVHPDQMAGVSARAVSIVATGDRPEYSELAERLRKRTSECHYHLVTDQVNWDRLSELGSVLMPHDLLHVIHQAIDSEHE